MARGRQYTQIISDVRAELRRNNDPGVRASDLPSIQQAVKRAYETLYDEYDWPHLRQVFAKIPLAAGQRYYDPTDDMDFDRMEKVVVWFNSISSELERGIGFEDYNLVDSEATTPARSDPAQKWDVRFVTTTEQIEIWPIPESNDQDLQFIGIKKFVQFVDDSDLCRIDDQIVILAAAIALETDKVAKQEKQIALAARLARVKARGKSGSKTYRLGLGQERPDNGRVTIRIAG